MDLTNMDFNEVIPDLHKRLEALKARVKKLEDAAEAKPAAAPKDGKRS